MKNKTIIFLLMIILISIKTVNAKQQTATGLSTNGNTITNYLDIMPKYFYINQNSNLQYWVMPIYQTKDDDPTNLYHTIILQFCSTNDFTVRLPNANGPATNLDYLKTDAKCTVYSQNDGFWTLVYIDYPNFPKLTGFVDMYTSEINVILTGSTPTNSTVILVNIYFADVNTYTRDILTVATGNSNALFSQYSQDIISNQNAINNSINNATNSINSKQDRAYNEDISNTTKQEVNTNEVNNTTAQEDTLLNMTGTTNMSILDIGIDTTSSNTIWNLITRILQQNAKIMQMVISILSIGIIKLILRR